MGQSKKWTDEEILFLKENWGKTSIPTLANKIGKSVNAVRVKAIQVGLGRHLHNMDCISFSQLLKALGLHCSYMHYKEKYLRYNIPIIYKKSVNKSYAMIKLEKFWEWAEDNKLILNFAKFEKGSLGVEPEWVDVKRRQDIKNPSKLHHNKPWTKENDNLLIEKVKSCRYTYAELSKEFKRTEHAIKRRLHDLEVPYRPVPRENHIKWTEEETKAMWEMHLKGYDSYTISKKLNKTELSIYDRIKNIEQMEGAKESGN